MAKTKKELLDEAKALNLEITEKNTIAEIQKAIDSNESENASVEEDGSEENVKNAKAGESLSEPLAKSGKRSEKGLKEAEEKKAKAERQTSETSEEEEKSAKPKHTQKPPRSRVERRGKKYQESVKLIDQNKQYDIKEALDLAIKTSKTKFDATVELHIRLNVDPKQADQNIRDNIVLPSGTGKTLRVAVLAEEDKAKKALAAGADIAGNEDLLEKIKKGDIAFDVLIATPNLMVNLAKYAKVLGPKGLMPNPKSGTVTTDVEKAVKQSKAGKIEYRVDSTGIVHTAVGKTSFGVEKLTANVDAVFASIKQNKPSSLKSSYVNSVVLTTSMGPSIRLQNSAI